MLNFVDGKYYAFDFEKILEKCLVNGRVQKRSKDKDNLKLVEKEVLEDFEGNEQLKPESRHVRELSAFVDQNSQNDTIAYDLFKTLVTPLIAGDFFALDNSEPSDDDEGEQKMSNGIYITPACVLSFNTMLREGFIVELENEGETESNA